MSEAIEPNQSERRMIYAVWDGIMDDVTEDELVEYVRNYSGTRTRRAVRTNVIRRIRRICVWR